MKRGWLVFFFVVVVISLGIFTIRGFGKEQKVTNQQNGQDMKIISEKIDEVLKNQKIILGLLQDIRKELDIIRVRASQR